MHALDDPFRPAEAEQTGLEFASLASRPLVMAAAEGAAHRLPDAAGGTATPAATLPVVATFAGFDLLDQALVSGVPQCPGELLVARSAVRLCQAQVGSQLVLLFEHGDPRRPLIMGVLGPAQGGEVAAAAAPSVLADGERQVIQAEREIVLKCGEASITLTRAGKVIIKGRYVLSRSSGVNKIKGAAVDIN